MEFFAEAHAVCVQGLKYIFQHGASRIQRACAKIAAVKVRQVKQMQNDVVRAPGLKAGLQSAKIRHPFFIGQDDLTVVPAAGEVQTGDCLAQ